MRKKQKKQKLRPGQEEAINNVYELPSTKNAILYWHAMTGFPPQMTWIKAIQAGNYNSWSLIMVQNINKYFPESDEMQKGHMQEIKKDVLFTKLQEINETFPMSQPEGKKRDIMMKVMNVRNDCN